MKKLKVNVKVKVKVKVNVKTKKNSIMGIGPMNLGNAGKKEGYHGCGTPMNKLTSEAQKQNLIAGAMSAGNTKFAKTIAEQEVG